MNVWKLVGPKKLKRMEAPLPPHEDGKVRVRVTKVLVNSVDAALYAGGIPAAYPIVLGRYAVGVVSEEGASAYLPRGTRVLLHTFRPIEAEGTEKCDFTAQEFDICGRTADGFLSDFVLVPPRHMTALPPSVSDERALILHHVAIAKAICDNLNVRKGQHVVVVGANLVGILTCQLLIYQQIAPILVDSVESHLAFARKCGVYYTLPADENVVEAVASVTGGRLADGAVYISTANGNSPDLPFSLTAHGGNVVVYGTSGGKVTLELSAALKKHLAIYCVTNGYGYLETAINLMANRAVDPTPYRANIVKAAQIETLLADYPRRKDRDADEINYIDML